MPTRGSRCVRVAWRQDRRDRGRARIGRSRRGRRRARPQRCGLLAETVHTAGVPGTCGRACRRTAHGRSGRASPACSWMRPVRALARIRRDPDIRWRRTPEDLARGLREEQLDLLVSAAAVLAPRRPARLQHLFQRARGERRGRRARSSRRIPDFTCIACRTCRRRSPLLADLGDARGYLRTDPARHGLEAFFGAPSCDRC